MNASVSAGSVITTDEVCTPSESRTIQPAPRPAPMGSLDLALGRLAVRVAQCGTFGQGSHLAAISLVEFIGGGRVAVGRVDRGGATSRLSAISTVTTVDHRSERAQVLEAALDEILLMDDTIDRSGIEGSGAASDVPIRRKAQEHLARLTGSSQVRGVRLQSGGTTRGVLLWYDEGASLDAEAAEQLLIRAGTYLGPVLSTVALAERSAVARMRDRFRELLAGKRKRNLIIACSILLGTLLIPLPYRITCGVRLEPTVRRFVVAPFEAILETTLVRPGDLVDAGSVVARLDGREVEWDLASVEAELAQATKRYDSALAGSKPAESELARLETEQLSLRKRQLERQHEQLDIKSPVQGVVLSGELERAAGAALTTGQTLLEIAPLDELLVEIEIPEDQLRFVDVNRSVSVKLDAFPGHAWQGTVRRIRPVGEVRDQQNVFIAEVSLNNDENALRPGMQGRAKIAGPIKPLAWILFHRPYDALRQWVGW